MRIKRILSVFLTACILLSLFPAFELPARAASHPDPAYKREALPEQVIFNAINGKNEDYFKSVMSSHAYNAVAAKKFKTYPNEEKTLTYDSKITDSGFTVYSWDDFRNTQLAKLSDAYDELEVGLAVTVTNNHHKHTYSIWDCWLTSYMDVDITTIPSMTPLYTARGYDSSMSSIRRGNARFHDIPDKMAKATGQNGKPLSLEYYGSILGYHDDAGTCKCGGSGSGAVVSFYDGTAPMIESVKLFRVNGEVLEETSNFKKGDTINIDLVCSEPIRFADDSADGKGDICIGLLVDGSANRLYAYLTKLEGNTMTFQYTVPTSDNNLYTIVGLDVTSAEDGSKALCTTKTKDTGIKLEQVFHGLTKYEVFVGFGSEEDRTYSVSKPASADSAVGYTETTSYVTDMAGNALAQTKKDYEPKIGENGQFVLKENGSVELVEVDVSAIPKVTFYIDCQAPFVAMAVVNGETYNDDVKGLPDMPNPNPSDLYLGVGDKISVTLYMNEVVDWVNYDVGTAATEPKITTNIRIMQGDSPDSDNDPYFTLTLGEYSHWTTAKDAGTGYGLGSSNGWISVIYSYGIWLKDYYWVDDPTGAIKITDISFGSNGVTDDSGNVALTSMPVKTSAEYFLDTTPPTVTAVTNDLNIQSDEFAAVQTGGVNTEFYVPFLVSDLGSTLTQSAASEAYNLPGTLVLNDPAGGTGRFEYVISSFTEPEAGTTWTWSTGYMGTSIPFTQTGTTQYLHIRPIQGESYNFSNFEQNRATIQFTLRDFAGNKITTEAKKLKFSPGVGVDTLPPKIALEQVTKTYDNLQNEGILQIKFKVMDPSGVRSVQYQWVAYTISPDTEPLDWLNNATVNYTDSEHTVADVEITANVQNGDVFQNVLWVKAADGSGSTEEGVGINTAKLGVFSYDLATGIKYNLNYTTDIQTQFQLIVDSIEAGGNLLFDVALEDSETHYLYFLSGSSTPATLFGSKTGYSHESWYKATLNTENGRIYTITQVNDYWYKSYTGNLYITVYSGDGDTVSNPSADTVKVNNNAQQESILLRRLPASTKKADRDAAFTGTRIFYTDNFESLSYAPSKAYYDVDNTNTSISTLEGLTVHIDLGTDAYGWDFEDIDWDNSYIFYDPVYDHNYIGADDFADAIAYVKNNPERKLCPIGRGPTQTIILPASSIYMTGVYQDLYLVLARYSSPETPYFFLLERDQASHRIAIDKTEPGRVELRVMGSMAINPDFYNLYSPRFQRISYDPNNTVYIPWEGQEVHLSVAALTAYGDPARYTRIILPSAVTYFYMGTYRVEACNLTENTNWKTLSSSWWDGTAAEGPIYGGDEGTYENRSITFTDMSDAYANYKLGLVPDQDNLIAFRIVYANGKVSELTYLTVHPVTIKLTGEITTSPETVGSGGLITVDPGTANVRFIPDAGANTAGLTLYCAPGIAYYEDPDSKTVVLYHFDYENLMANKPELFRMEQEGDAYVWHVYDASEQAEYESGIENGIISFMPEYGEYFNSLDVYDPYEDSHDSEPAGFYIVYAVDQYRNRHILGITDNAIIGDGRAPQVAEITDRDDDQFEAKGTVTQEDEGVYTASYTIWDDSLYAYDNGALSRPMTLTLSFDESYAALAGTGNLTLTNVGDGYSWTAEESNRMGILKVTATLNRSDTPEFKNSWYAILPSYADTATEVCLKVDVTFAVSPKLTAAKDVTLYLAATDAHGNAAEPVGAVAANAVGAKPQVTQMRYENTGVGDDMALYLTFNVPVQPQESWINRSISSFEAEWHDAFPIWNDGNWQITFTDIFGDQYTQEINVNVIGEYGIDLGFSSLDYVPASEGVTITAAADGDGETVTGSATVTANGTYTVKRIAGGKTDTLTIYLNNIVTGEPECTLYFYFEEFCEMFAAGANNQPRGTTTAPVVVSYRTDREVSPIGATTATIRSNEDNTFTFEYRDVVTNTLCSVSGSLSEYSIDFGAPPEEYTDQEAPSIDIVTIWKQRGKGFVQAEAFPGSASAQDIETAILNSGFAQSYDFVVNASDYSRWKVLVTASAPTGITHESEGDDIFGVLVQGNNVLVTEDATDDFWVVVVDYASVDTAATADNFAAIMIPSGNYRFDTTAPVIDVVTVANGLYSKTVYIRATDKDNRENNTGAVTISGAGIVEETVTIDSFTYTHKLIFEDNSTEIMVTATDGAGNSASLPVKVTGIDVEKPILSITWSPCFKDPKDGNLYPENPTIGPVNVDVVAHITSNKDIFSVTAVDVSDGSALVFDENNVAVTAWGSVKYTGERITVRFTKKEAMSVLLTVTAPNNKSTTTEISLGAGVIDKDPPVVTDTVTPLLREGFGAAYAELHTLTFDEDVYCMNDMKAGTLYNSVRPYEVTLWEGETAVLDFVDKAGNLLTYTVVPLGDIDSTRPDAEATVDEGLSVTNAAVPVTITANEFCTLTAEDDDVTCGEMTLTAGEDGNVWTGTVTASRNGTFRVTASDAAGNSTAVCFTVSNIDRTLPHIRFEKSTISVREGSDMEALLELLEKNITVWDNVDSEAALLDTLTWYTEDVTLFDTVYHAVDLNTPGIYEIPYTVTDSAGNVGLAVRFVRVVDKNQLVLSVDGILMEKNGATAFRVGEHTVTVGGLLFDDEPYTLVMAKGLLTAGQMKRAKGLITVGQDGVVNFEETGYYILYVTAQSRRSFRTLIYVDD